MPTESNRFYEKLEGFTDFSQFPEPRWYRPLPEDWCVVVTDVCGSTRAIEQGRYKEVNGVGVASIVALINAVKPLRVPYVFGGDGATACFPIATLDRVKPALVAAREMSQAQFGLELRIGVVHMAEIRQKGCEVLVGKHQPHRHYQQAMFQGDGLGFAEKLIKDPDPANPYLVREGVPADRHIFKGFECRWNEIPSPHEENIALLVQAQGETDRLKDRIYVEVLKEVEAIYGKDTHYNPLRQDNLYLTRSSRLLSVEAGVRTAFQAGAQRRRYQLKLQLLRWAGNWLMATKSRLGQVKWGEYKKDVVINTDYRKFDELLRMVISGSAAQRGQLRSVLESYRRRGQIVFGLYAAPSALITCIVTSYDKDHVHFLDGANGGYAMAAREMKRQIKQS